MREPNLRRFKRLTKIYPIFRLNNPVSSDYRKHRQKTERSEKYLGHRKQTETLTDQTIERTVE